MLWPWALGAALVLAVLGLSWWAAAALVLTGVDLLIRVIRAGRRLTGLAANVGVGRVARAVADALQARGLVSAGAGAVAVEIRGQELRCRLSGCPRRNRPGLRRRWMKRCNPFSDPDT